MIEPQKIHEPGCRGLLIAVVAALLALTPAGCKPQPKEPPRPSASNVKESSGSAAEHATGAPATVENPDQKCGGTQEKVEAQRRAKLASLEAPLSTAARGWAAVDHMRSITTLAAERKFGQVHEINAATGERMKGLSPSWMDQNTEYLESAASEKLGEFATCRALAQKDTSWCTSLEPLGVRLVDQCLTMSFIYLTLASQAVPGKGKCEDLVAKARLPSALDQPSALAACKAVTGKDPALLPFGKGTALGTFSEALALRDGRGVCSKVTEEVALDWTGCCENVAWRFANVAAGLGDERLVPEIGALSGDSKGCDNALVWGLFEIEAPLFGVCAEAEVPGPPAGFVRPTDGTQCEMHVYWTATAPPALP